jgi:hypothetical protein
MESGNSRFHNDHALKIEGRAKWIAPKAPVVSQAADLLHDYLLTHSIWAAVFRPICQPQPGFSSEVVQSRVTHCQHLIHDQNFRL